MDRQLDQACIQFWNYMENKSKTKVPCYIKNIFL